MEENFIKPQHNKDKDEEALNKAREMLIDGKTNDEIKEETGLRPKAVGRIQKEITKHF
ncbi:hypothetical protein KM792_12255 [Clostridium tyrobutyricum]|mgnify:FL=1|jgi:DNA invertase Pin-like site-specific DNA recombinase|uniref:hypothetical protein n=1 Tax=Clostridium tyrobutyricum TaxID=1519 RepID=UPI000B2230A3|nr:hypothetical protein [Clostridium tyrobutyricum]MBV4450420.1 hypothetical protein [Clostridium tyrobutyricum]MCH4200216.1 hypothetical protein [Clostridium tyrobutyricum]MCH4258938.1 hypothetical protein [Clostridium tyrobutyricum]MCI1239789.1 hypothetical protein [Clostridium tyrobutyricum]MCI1653065.1 hypothetical protein [Clostridium tyrobutyricum]